MPNLLSAPDPVVASPTVGLTIVPGAPVIGAEGARIGMVSALAPDPAAPTHFMVFVAERQQLIPREYPLPLTSVVRVDNGGAVHVAVTRDGLRGVEGPRRRGGDETS